VRVSILFPPGVTIVGVAGASQGVFDPGSGIWTIGNLAVGQVVTLRVIGQVSGSEVLISTAIVSADQMDIDPANNISSTPVTDPMPESMINKDMYLSSTQADPTGTNISPTTLPPAVPGSTAIYATGAGAGGMPLVQVFDRGTGELRLSFLAFDAGFRGGVSVAIGNLTGNGTPDIVVAAGVGGQAHIKVFDGATGALLQSFLAFPGYSGTVSVAVGDVTGAGHDDIIVGAASHSHVKVFDGLTGALLQSFYAFDPNYSGVISVAAGDVTGSGHADIIVGADAHSHVKVFDGVTGQLLDSFFAFDPNYMGEISVAAGDVTGSGRADIIVGAAAHSHIKVFDGVSGATVASFFAFTGGYMGPVSVSAADLNHTGKADVVVAAGANNPPQINTINPLTGDPIDEFLAYNRTFTGGVSVSATNR
jgi:hypothetical protein